MSDRALREAVLRDLDDPIARIAYAQSLDANGDPLGEFIRVQCALRERVDVGDVYALRATQDELLKKHRAHWLGAASAMKPFNPVFRGGFLDALGEVNVKLFIEHAAEVLAEHPVRRVTLTGVKTEHAAELRGLACMAGLTHLTVRGSLRDRGLAQLADAPWMLSIESLNVGSNGISAKGVAALAESPGASNLRALALHSNELEDDGAAALAGETTLGRCQALYLTASGVTDAGVAALARNTSLRSLRLLALGRNEVTEEGVASLAGSDALVTLKRLDLHGNDITDGGAKALAKSTALASLESVDLRRCRFTPATVRALKERFRSVAHGYQ